MVLPKKEGPYTCFEYKAHSGSFCLSGQPREMRPKPVSTVEPGGQQACIISGTCKHKDNSPSGAQHEQETLGLEVVPACRQYVADRAAPREGPATAVGSAAVINHPGQCAAHGEMCHWVAVCGLGLHGLTADNRLCCAWRAQAKVR